MAKKPKPTRRNPAAQVVRSKTFRPLVVKPKKGKGAYIRRPVDTSEIEQN